LIDSKNVLCLCNVIELSLGGNGGRGGDVILECTHAVWDFSGLQPHIVSVSVTLFVFSGNMSHENFSELVISMSFAERWESWTRNFQKQDRKQRRRQGFIMFSLVVPVLLSFIVRELRCCFALVCVTIGPASAYWDSDSSSGG